jgi:glycosyltransferase 2 family protein
MKKRTRRWLSLGVTAAALVLIVYNLTRGSEWRHFDWNRLWATLLSARHDYLLAAVVATLSSYLVRAYRWRFFMDPFKKASLWTLFVAQVYGFSSIYLIGRPGEFVRPAYIARKENVSISSMLAIWVLERVYDTVFMVLIFALALGFAPLHLTGPHGHAVLYALHRASVILTLGMLLAIAVLVVIRLRADNLAALLGNRLRFLPPRIRRSMKRVFYSFAEGLDVIRNWKDLVASLLTSAVVWIVNISMVWFGFQSLGGRLGELTWMSAALVLFCAALGLFIQLPGVGGGYQVGVIVALHRIFAIPREPAAGVAILLWIAMLVPCLALGLLLLAYEGLSFKKLGAMAHEEEKRAAMHQKV